MRLELLKQKRKEAGYKQDDMARILGPYSRQCYNMKELGKCGFRKSEIKILKEMFQLTKEECFDLFLGE